MFWISLLLQLQRELPNKVEENESFAMLNPKIILIISTIR